MSLPKKNNKDQSPSIVPVVKAGVGVIVIKDKKVLVGQRKGSHGEGLWAFPGGTIEPTDKSLKSCGEREVFEETGIICNIFNPDHYREDLFTTYDILSKTGARFTSPRILWPTICSEARR
jgi:8-oxo-dGTP pyrophosphatase MutT (NUDIX family)